MRALVLAAALALAGCGAPAHQHLGDCETCLGTAMVVAHREAGRLDAGAEQRSVQRDRAVLQRATTSTAAVGSAGKE